MAKQIDDIPDQILDGRNVCPGHALHVEGATNQYDCEWCEFPRGYKSAQVHYKFKHTGGHPMFVEEWEQEWERVKNSERGVGGGWLHHYNSGYCQFVQECLAECYEKNRERESVLKAKEKLKDELGAREFTLTYSPDWFETDEQAQSAMKVAIDRLIKYYRNEIIEFHAVGEFTGAGRSHVHAWYYLIGGRKITDKNFKRAWSRWNPRKKLGRGFEGGHHASVNRIADFSGYIEKHLEEAWLVVDINANQEEVNSSSSSSASSQDDA